MLQLEDEEGGVTLTATGEDVGIARWRVASERYAKPTAERGTERAVAVDLAEVGKRGVQHVITVEYTRIHLCVSPRDAVDPYLADEIPPRCLVVALEGVSVAG